MIRLHLGRALQRATTAQFLDEWRDRMDPGLVACMDDGQAHTAREYVAMRGRKLDYWDSVRPLFERFDLLLTPTTSVPAFQVGRLNPEGWPQHAWDWFPWASFRTRSISPVSPPTTVPAGFTPGGLPVGSADRRPPLRRPHRAASRARLRDRATLGRSAKPARELRTYNMPDSVGFIGLGTMGGPMAANLAKAGVPLVVHDASHGGGRRGQSTPGVRVVGSPGEVAAHVSVLFTCLPNDAIVRAVYLAPGGIAPAGAPGLITCDCSTVSPEATLEVAAGVKARGIVHMDTPMLGSQPQAVSGEIFFIVGGDVDKRGGQRHVPEPIERPRGRRPDGRPRRRRRGCARAARRRRRGGRTAGCEASHGSSRGSPEGDRPAPPAGGQDPGDAEDAHRPARRVQREAPEPATRARCGECGTLAQARS